MDIQQFAINEVATPEVKLQLQKALSAYRTALAKSWVEKDTPNVETERQLADLERELDALHNQARLLSK